LPSSTAPELHAFGALKVDERRVISMLIKCYVGTVRIPALVSEEEESRSSKIAKEPHRAVVVAVVVQARARRKAVSCRVARSARLPSQAQLARQALQRKRFFLEGDADVADSA
jgi:hypothetical protein